MSYGDLEKPQGFETVTLRESAMKVQIVLSHRHNVVETECEGNERLFSIHYCKNIKVIDLSVFCMLEDRVCN